MKRFGLLLPNLLQERSKCIVTGDTKINLLKVNERIEFQEYLDIFITNGLFSQITFPTRYNLNKNTVTLIDHLFCQFIWNINLQHFKSSTILHLYKTNEENNSKKKTLLAYENTEQLINEFPNYVSNAVNYIPINNDLLGNPNDSYNVLKNILTEAKSKTSNPAKFVLTNSNRSFLHEFRLVLSTRLNTDTLYRKLKKTDVEATEYTMSCQIIYVYTTQYLKRTLD